MITFSSSWSVPHTQHLIFFQAFQKIHLSQNIRGMADLIYTNVIQQLKVALLGSPAAKILDIICAGMGSTTGTAFQQPGAHPW